MRYLGNNTNIVRDAVLTATNGVASDAIYRTDTDPKEGGGLVEITGPYTGAADCTIDVEIVDNGGSTTQTSQPILTGVGNGTMTDVAATGVDPQTFTVALEDLGTDTRAAYATFQGIPLKAAATGSGGNDIAIDVDHSALVIGSTDWSLREDLRQGTNEYVGDHWNFGAAVLEPAGTIPASAPRLSFGSDPQVYRQYKKYVQGKYVYSFDPSPVRDVHAGARVHTVAGSRSITITNGVTTELLSDIITLYDALVAIRDNSALVVVDAPIVNDRQPGGQGISELSVRTRSYVLSVTPTEQGPIAHVELDIAADDTAPTETVTVTCKEAGIAGAEVWEVRGTVSDRLTDAITGVLYQDGHYDMTIPPAPVQPGSPSGRIFAEFIPNPNRAAEAVVPTMCVVNPRLGSMARDGTYTFTYTRRPSADCDCTTGNLEGGPNSDCLGTAPEGGDVSEASQLIRLQRLATAVRELLQVNTNPSADYGTFNIPWIETSAQILKKCLAKLASAKLDYTDRVNAHAYKIDEVSGPAVRNGYRYAVTTSGSSAASEPGVWTTTVGGTVTDGTVTWTNIGKLPYGMYDDVFDQWKSEAEVLAINALAVVPAWEASHTYSGETITVRPTTRNGWLYVGSAGVSDVSEPTWPTVEGDSVVDGTITWFAYREYWEASTAYTVGQTAVPGNGRSYTIQSGGAGTSDVTEPNWPLAPNGTQFTDGTVTWTTFEVGVLPVATNDLFFERYRTMCTDVLAAAGVDADFEQASVNGDGCWQDFDDSDYWFAYDGTNGVPYLPIQVGHYYHAAKIGMDEDGRPFARTTREWGFGPKFGCPDSLIEGDQIKVTIEGAGGGTGAGYSVGDAFTILVNQANPLPFGGGQTGDDTLTFSVIGSVDGRLDNYPLITTALAPYSAAAGSGTLEFQITPGGIPFALGDRFDFAIEGGRFKWRRNGGAWSSDLDIADTALVDGLSVTFTGGSAPSWVGGDRWSFAAEATYGIDNIRTPVDGEFEWSGGTVIGITPTDTEIVGVALVNHAIPSDATITLQGSDDNFSTTPLSVVIPWRKGDIWKAIAADRAKYRLSVDRGGAMRWLYLGPSTQPEMAGGLTEIGRVTKHRRSPGIGVRAGMSADVEHTALSQAGVDALIDMVDYACENDDRLIAFVPNDARPEVYAVRVQAEPIDFTDELAFQPEDIGHSLQACTIKLEAAA